MREASNVELPNSPRRYDLSTEFILGKGEGLRISRESLEVGRWSSTLSVGRSPATADNPWAPTTDHRPFRLAVDMLVEDQKAAAIRCEFWHEW